MGTFAGASVRWRRRGADSSVGDVDWRAPSIGVFALELAVALTAPACSVSVGEPVRAGECPAPGGRRRSVAEGPVHPSVAYTQKRGRTPAPFSEPTGRLRTD